IFAESGQISNPIYLGNMLVDETSIDKMEQICRYYSLMEENTEDGFKTFVHPDGTVIQFKFDMSDDRKIPVVKLKTKASSKIINEILSTTGYSHTSDGYVKGSKFEHRRTKCSVTGTTKKTLTFTKEYNSLE
ncbi:MAG: hypothetical protein K2J78_06155, partial [Muribaculaceae bacterium]|nr:hypothetical protein [Muribaculaceae bacterium]